MCKTNIFVFLLKPFAWLFFLELSVQLYFYKCIHASHIEHSMHWRDSVSAWICLLCHWLSLSFQTTLSGHLPWPYSSFLWLHDGVSFYPSSPMSLTSCGNYFLYIMMGLEGRVGLTFLIVSNWKALPPPMSLGSIPFCKMFSFSEYMTVGGMSVQFLTLKKVNKLRGDY